MQKHKFDSRTETKPSLSRQVVESQRDEHEARDTRLPQRGPFAPVISGIGDTSSAGVHASMLNRATNGRPSRAGQSLLRLQRQYGNRYVQRLLALAGKGAAETEAAPELEQSIQRSRGGGQALDNEVRSQMEPAFDADFSGVRVHTGAQSNTLNRELNARAFTTGQDVFFRQGAYNPGSSSGRELIAHELTHVVQQNGDKVQRKLTVGQPGDKYEQEADQVARAVMQQEQRPVQRDSDGGLVRRQIEEEEEEEVQMKSEHSRVQRQVEEEEEEEEPVQSKMQDAQAQQQGEEEEEEHSIQAKDVPSCLLKTVSNLEYHIQSLRSRGQALERGMRAQIEPALGTEISGVRVRKDSRAAERARAFKPELVGPVMLRQESDWPDPRNYTSNHSDVGAIVAGTRKDGALPVPYKQEMESAFGADFGLVKAYTGPHASDACQQLSAKAFSFSSNEVVFKDASPDKTTVAHELAHVMQRSGSLSRKTDASAHGVKYSHASEIEARRVEQLVASGQRVDVSLGATLGRTEIAKVHDLEGLKKKGFSSPEFWIDLGDVFHEILQDWVMRVWCQAIGQFESDMNVKGEKGWTHVGWAFFRQAIGLMGVVGKYAKVAVHTLEAAVETLTSTPDSLPDFLADLRGLNYEAQVKKKGKSKLKQQEIKEPKEANDQLEHRTRVVSDLKADLHELEAMTFQMAMRPFIISWIKSSEDSLDSDDWSGVIEVHLDCDRRGWATLDEAFIDDVERPHGALKALKRAFGVNTKLTDLPLPMRVCVERDMPGILDVTSEWHRDSPSSRWLPAYPGAVLYFRKTKEGFHLSQFLEERIKPSSPMISDLETD